MILNDCKVVSSSCSCSLGSCDYLSGLNNVSSFGSCGSLYSLRSIIEFRRSFLTVSYGVGVVAAAFCYSTLYFLGIVSSAHSLLPILKKTINQQEVEDFLFWFLFLFVILFSLSLSSSRLWIIDQTSPPRLMISFQEENNNFALVFPYSLSSIRSIKKIWIWSQERMERIHWHRRGFDALCLLGAGKQNNIFLGSKLEGS